ncbi:MAG TPA: hypothetical protein VHY37_08160 [Tepidisphaeraceae bacterium]|jgi:hypothetical protein|nr:hypothetical protein [Tepidisphaeraceae bacterium]
MNPMTVSNISPLSVIDGPHRILNTSVIPSGAFNVGIEVPVQAAGIAPLSPSQPPVCTNRLGDFDPSELLLQATIALSSQE